VRARFVAAGALGILALASSASAQRAQRAPPRALQARPLQAPRASDSLGRARLENEIRRGFARAVRQRVGLNDDQMSRLGPLATRYEQQRRRLQVEERDTRLSLRAALRNEQTADQKQVEQLMQRMLEIQKRRLELVESEQRELATIMTPVQRAKFTALQEQIRRRVEQMRQRRMQLFDSDTTDASEPSRRPGRRPL
jgi:hypothetical protein